MSFLASPIHPSFTAAQAEGKVQPEMLQLVWAGAGPLVILLEPSINFDAFWSIVNANASKGVSAIFTGLEAGASSVITSPSFEAQIFSVGCRVAANFWDHLVTTGAITAPRPELGATPDVS
jgi:hypothetical protein